MEFKKLTYIGSGAIHNKHSSNGMSIETMQDDWEGSGLFRFPIAPQS